MRVLEWHVAPLDMKIDNKCYESGVEDEFMRFNLEVEAFFKS